MQWAIKRGLIPLRTVNQINVLETQWIHWKNLGTWTFFGSFWVASGDRIKAFGGRFIAKDFHNKGLIDCSLKTFSISGVVQINGNR